MIFRPIAFRSFLYPQKWKRDVISWEVSTLGKEVDSGDIYLSVDIFDGTEGYSFSTSNYGTNGKRVPAAEALKPLNDLIDALSKAGIEFAKACNSPPKIQPASEAKKPKASKNDKPKK